MHQYLKELCKTWITKKIFKNGEFKVVLSNINSPSGISKVEFPTWTNENGQDDIKWYQGAKEGNKRMYPIILDKLRSLIEYD